MAPAPATAPASAPWSFSLPGLSTLLTLAAIVVVVVMAVAARQFFKDIKGWCPPDGSCKCTVSQEDSTPSAPASALCRVGTALEGGAAYVSALTQAPADVVNQPLRATFGPIVLGLVGFFLFVGIIIQVRRKGFAATGRWISFPLRAESRIISQFDKVAKDAHDAIEKDRARVDQQNADDRLAGIFDPAVAAQREKALAERTALRNNLVEIARTQADETRRLYNEGERDGVADTALRARKMGQLVARVALRAELEADLARDPEDAAAQNKIDENAREIGRLSGDVGIKL